MVGDKDGILSFSWAGIAKEGFNNKKKDNYHQTRINLDQINS